MDRYALYVFRTSLLTQPPPITPIIILTPSWQSVGEISLLPHVSVEGNRNWRLDKVEHNFVHYCVNYITVSKKNLLILIVPFLFGLTTDKMRWCLSPPLWCLPPPKSRNLLHFYHRRSRMVNKWRLGSGREGVISKKPVSPIQAFLQVYNLP